MNSIFGNSDTFFNVTESSSSKEVMNLDDMELVQEVYIGKTPELEAIDKEFDKLIDKYKKDQSFNINTDPSLRSIETLVKKQFGFKTAKITFSTSTGVNALTLTQSTIVSVVQSGSKRLTKQTGYYDKEHVCAFHSIIFLGMLTMQGMTGKHVTAILLHEIGHNFYCSPYSICQDITRLAIAPSTMISTEVLKMAKGTVFNIMDFINKAINANKGVYNFLINFQNTMRPLAEYINMLSTIMNGSGVVAGSIKVNFKDPLNVRIASAAQRFFNGPGEFHADEVATMYGYGPELNQVFYTDFDRGGKNSLRNLLKESGESGSFSYDLLATATEIFGYVMNPLQILKSHPEEQTRMSNSIKKLKKDLKKKQYPPEIEKAILSDINECEKCLDNYVKCTDTQGEVFHNVVKVVRHKIFGDADVQSLLPHIRV